MSQKMLLVFRASSPFLNAVHQSRVFDWNSFSWKSGKEVGNSHGRNWKSRPSQISKSWYQKSFVISRYQEISYRFIQNFSVRGWECRDGRDNTIRYKLPMIPLFVQWCHSIHQIHGFWNSDLVLEMPLFPLLCWQTKTSKNVSFSVSP